LAAAAVVDGDHPEIVKNEDVTRLLNITDEFLAAEAERKLAEIERRRTAYLGGRTRVPLRGRTAIVVDDGIATGATTRAALRAVKRAEPKRLVLAVPVAPPETVESLRPECDELVCLATPAPFVAIGAFYADFRQVADDEVIAVLRRAQDRRRGRETDGGADAAGGRI
jgi:putative phosphoribosyl transferase